MTLAPINRHIGIGDLPDLDLGWNNRFVIFCNRLAWIMLRDAVTVVAIFDSLGHHSSNLDLFLFLPLFSGSFLFFSLEAVVLAETAVV